MGKLQNNEKGFSAVEAVLVVLVVALIGVVGWLVYKDHHKTTTANVATTASTQSAATKPQPAAKPKVSTTKTYTDSSSTYTVTYPKAWTYKASTPSDWGDSTPVDSTEVRFTPTGLPSGAAGNTWVGISAFKGSLSSVMKDQAYAESESYNPKTLDINGYQAAYHQEVVPATPGSNGAPGGMGYTDDYYGVYHNGVTLVFYFREKQDGNGIASSFNASATVPAYTALVKSVKFLN